MVVSETGLRRVTNTRLIDHDGKVNSGNFLLHNDGTYSISNGDEKKPGKKLKEDLQMKDFLLRNPGCVVSNLVVEKDLFIGLGGFDEYIHPSNDKDFIIRALYFGYKYDVLRENLVNIRRHTNTRETDISSEYLIGMEKFFKKHYFIANFTLKFKFWFKYWFLFIKSKI